MGYISQEMTFPIDADSAWPLGIALSAGALGAMGQERWLLPALETAGACSSQLGESAACPHPSQLLCVASGLHL